MPMEGGSYIERTFAAGAPARGVGVYVGDELLNMTRRQQVNKFQVEPHRLVVAVNIPKKELQMNSGKLAVIRLIEEYPQSVMEGVKADLNAFLLTGASRGLVFQSAEMRGLLHLNGALASGIGTGVTNGLLDWQPPANQGDTVQNVAKSESSYHFNQYAEVSSWDGISTIAKQGGGMRALRGLYRQCAHYAGGIGKGPDLVIMDDDVYTNFEDQKLSQVRVNIVEDKTEKSNTIGLDIGVAKVYSSIDLDRSTMESSSATGADYAPDTGCTYILNTDFIEFPMHEAPQISEFKERVGDQDVVTAIFSMQGNLICTKLPAQGCMAGGATAIATS
jgi:hypothetical protein